MKFNLWNRLKELCAGPDCEYCGKRDTDFGLCYVCREFIWLETTCSKATVKGFKNSSLTREEFIIIRDNILTAVWNKERNLLEKNIKVCKKKWL